MADKAERKPRTPGPAAVSNKIKKAVEQLNEGLEAAESVGLNVSVSAEVDEDSNLMSLTIKDLSISKTFI